eukprot:TRINITY_DN1237_c0_g1_i1.p1 TRINITY_DN1237_c0_g1~~TRINITY_DN1237_c0_g1_i1.p1  ORF type:complete len:232 (+),score=17.82 TRINITY_DN1237_c0_g1_i1:3-698(+)
MHYAPRVHHGVAQMFRHRPDWGKELTPILAAALNRDARFAFLMLLQNEHSVDYGFRDHLTGQTLLHISTTCGSSQCFRWLLRRNIDVRAVDCEGKSIAHHLCYNACDWQDLPQCLQLAAAAGADFDTASRSGEIPLTTLACRGAAILQMLHTSQLVPQLFTLESLARAMRASIVARMPDAAATLISLGAPIDENMWQPNIFTAPLESKHSTAPLAAVLRNCPPHLHVSNSA